MTYLDKENVVEVILCKFWAQATGACAAFSFALLLS